MKLLRPIVLTTIACSWLFLRLPEAWCATPSLPILPLATSSWKIYSPPPTWTAPPWRAGMEETVRSAREHFPGDFGLYISDVHRGFRFAHNAQKPFYLASGVKLAFMLEVFRQREQGKLRFDETLVYGEDQVRDGAPRLNPLAIGSKISIRDLLEYMMRYSDNSASDMLAGRVGLENVQLGLEEEGLHGFTPLTYMMEVRRGIYREVDIRADDFTPLEIRTIRWTPVWEPQIAKLNEILGVPVGRYDKVDLLRAYDHFYATGVNRAPVAVVGQLFERLILGQLVSRSASMEMLQLMTDAKTSTARILGQLPKDVVISHKTGSQWERICDMGVVLLPDRHPLVIAACTEKGEAPPSEALVAKLARKAYDLAVADHRSSDHQSSIRPEASVRRAR